MIIQQYQFQLAKRGKWHCPECGRKTFVCYVDADGNVLNERVGKCDRADNCAFHYPPKQFFADNASMGNVMQRQYRAPILKHMPPPTYISPDLFKQTLRRYDVNNLIKFLCSMIDANVVSHAIHSYYIGTSQYWKGSTVFWQVDGYGNIHRGKIMLYNADTGKRVKKPFSHITSVNSVLKLGDNQPPQCLFGEHLLSDFHDMTVAIVESEKTAIIASCVFGDCITLASGGCGNLTPSMCEALRGRDVILFPDNGKYHEWEAKAKRLKHLFAHARISSVMETHAASPGDDIGDLFIQHIITGKDDDELQTLISSSIVTLY